MRYIRMVSSISSIGLLAGVLLAACAAPVGEQATAGKHVPDEPGGREMVVYRSPACGCCSDWVAYVEEHGYTATVVEDTQNLTAFKAKHHVPPTMQSCHTAVVDGYIIEGHVPVEDIERLLTERPDVAGIAVPGMPVGSPGMEVEGVPPQPFEVVTFDAAGNTEVYSTHNQ